MRYRIYTVRLPTDFVAAPTLDIPVEGPFGPAPTVVGVDGFYAEWRNRPLRCPNKLSLGAAQFVPRFRLGFQFSVLLAAGGGALADQLQILFSQSLVGNVVTTAGGGTTAGDAALADPNGAPVIRFGNNAAVAGRLFRLYLGVCQTRDDDRDDTGS